MTLVFFENSVLVFVVISFIILLLNYLNTYHVLNSDSVIRQIDLLLNCTSQIKLELICFLAVLVWLQARCACIITFFIIVSVALIFFNLVLGGVQRLINFCFFYYLYALSLEALTLKIYIGLSICILLLLFSLV